jgi:hypothetical protein
MDRLVTMGLINPLQRKLIRIINFNVTLVEEVETVPRIQSRRRLFSLEGGGGEVYPTGFNIT